MGFTSLTGEDFTFYQAVNFGLAVFHESSDVSDLFSFGGKVINGVDANSVFWHGRGVVNHIRKGCKFWNIHGDVSLVRVNDFSIVQL